MSLIGRRVVFTKAQSKGFDLIEGEVIDANMAIDLYCIESDNGNAHFIPHSHIVSFVNKNEEPKTIRIMANDLYNFDLDLDYKDVRHIPVEGVKVNAKPVYYSVLGVDITKNKLLLVTKVEHKANGLVCVYVEPIND